MYVKTRAVYRIPILACIKDKFEGKNKGLGVLGHQENILDSWKRITQGPLRITSKWRKFSVAFYILA